MATILTIVRRNQFDTFELKIEIANYTPINEIKEIIQMAIEQSTQAALDAAAAVIEEEKAEVEALVSGLRTSIATLESSIADMRTQMGALQEQVVTLEVQIASASTMPEAERFAINAQIAELAVKASNINVATTAIADAAAEVVVDAEALVPAPSPVVEAPVVEAPVVEAPVVETPVVETAAV